jgi:Ca2+-binding RTX toxin-like protein
MPSLRIYLVALSAALGGCATNPQVYTQISQCSPPGTFDYRLHGGRGNDQIYAGGTTQLFGEEDRDLLVGGTKDDELVGGADADTMQGALGADRFVYERENDSPADQNGDWHALSGDTIVDFDSAEGDRVVLTQLAPSRGLGWAGNTNGAYAVWTRPGDSDTILFVETTGDQAADVAIRFFGDVSLSEAAVCI